MNEHIITKLTKSASPEFKVEKSDSHVTANGKYFQIIFGLDSRGVRIFAKGIQILNISSYKKEAEIMEQIYKDWFDILLDTV
jgi:hypothetical protein